MADARALATYRRAFARRAVPLSVQRVTGVAPNAAIRMCLVPGVVTGYAGEGGEGYSGPGEITRGVRQVVLLVEDLQAAGFPLPMRKNDKIVLPDGTEQLNVETADAETRGLAAAIVCTISGVS